MDKKGKQPRIRKGLKDKKKIQCGIRNIRKWWARYVTLRAETKTSGAITFEVSRCAVLYRTIETLNCSNAFANVS